eukprot:436806-Amphidinium_carterae.6
MECQGVPDQGIKEFCPVSTVQDLHTLLNKLGPSIGRELLAFVSWRFRPQTTWSKSNDQFCSGPLRYAIAGVLHYGV